MNRRAFPIALVLLALMGQSAAFADEKVGIGVADEAHMFSPEVVAASYPPLVEAFQKSGWKVFVKTVDKIDGIDLKAAAKPYFDEDHLRGLLILIVKDAHKVEVIPSRDAERRFSPEATASLRDTLVNAFKKKEFDRGLTDVVAEATKLSTATPLQVKPYGVKDEAKLFPPDAVEMADEILGKTFRDNHWEVIIDVVDSLSGKTIREVATKAKEARIDGLYVLISKGDHKTFLLPHHKNAEKVLPKAKIDELLAILDDNLRLHQYRKGLLAFVNKVRGATQPNMDVFLSSETKFRPIDNTSTRTAGQQKDIPTTATGKMNPGADPSAEHDEAAANESPKWPLYAGIGVGILGLVWLASKAFQRPPSPAAPAGSPPGYGPSTSGPANQGYGPPPTPGYGPQAGYGSPGYGPPTQSGGGFVQGALGGLGGAIAGNYLYDKFARPHDVPGQDYRPEHGAPPVEPAYVPTTTPENNPAPDSSYDPSAGAEGDWGSASPDDAATNDGNWSNESDAGAQGDWGSADPGPDPDQGQDGGW